MLRPTGWRILKILLAAVRRCIEQRTRIAVGLGAAGVGRIGVEHLVAQCEEYAQPVLLAEQVVRAVVRFVLRLAAIIVFRWPDLRVVGHLEIIVELGAERRIPWHIPSPLPPVGIELCERGARYQRESRVALAEQREVTQRVQVPRAARTSLVPCRIE